MSLWDGAKESAAKAGEAAMIATQKTMLQGEIMLLDREIQNRKRSFGVELYDHVQIFSTRPEFYSSDDLLTTTLRPPLLKAQREIAALEIKRGKFREDIAQAEVERRSAFPVPATTWYEKMMNAGKAARLAGNETKLRAELSMVEIQMRDYKETFGLDLFNALTELEDTRGWLPTDREVRSLYDNARRDIEKAEEKRKKKEQEIVDLGGDVVRDPNNSYAVPNAAVVGAAGATVSEDSSGMFVMSNPSPAYNAAGSSTSSTQQGPPPPGKGGGYGSSVPCPAPAAASNSSGGYGTSTPSVPAHSMYGGSDTGYGTSVAAVPAPAPVVYGGGYRPNDTSATTTAAPVATPVVAATATTNQSSFGFMTQEDDPFACLSGTANTSTTYSTEGNFLGNNNNTSTQAPTASSSTVRTETTSNSLSGLFAGITDSSSSSSSSGAGASGSTFAESISGALVKASLKNPKAAAGALSAAESISSSFKF